MAGMLAAVNGANMRVLVINLTSPEARGASIALLGTYVRVRVCSCSAVLGHLTSLWCGVVWFGVQGS
jgi:hypothetical protein